MFRYSNSAIRTQKAFTLIELLVVMVFIGLIATLIVQGFGYSMGLYQRVVKAQRSIYGEVLAYNWFRSSLAAQVAARPKDIGLEGSATALSTYSYQPLLAPQGMKTRISWRLNYKVDDVILNYTEANQSFDTYEWSQASAKFEYLNEAGQWIDHWPPEKVDIPSLPRALRIQVNSGGELRNYVVVSKTRIHSLVTMDELLNGR